MASLLPQLFLDSGAGLTPSDGALLHFNVVGSGTDKDTYTTAAATVANANPVVANSKGVFPPIYITGSYDWVLQNKNAVQQNTGTVNEVLLASEGAFSKNFETLAAAVADTRLVDDDALNIAGRLVKNDGGGGMWDVVLSSSVTETTYEVVQCTGVGTLSLVARNTIRFNAKQAGALSGSDDAPAINSLLAALPSTGGTVFCPAGAYTLATEVWIKNNSKFLQFEPGAIVTIAPTAELVVFRIENESVFVGGANDGKLQPITNSGLLGEVVLKSSDETYKKTLIKAIDVSNCKLESIKTESSGSANGHIYGAGSIGLDLYGREFLYTSNLAINAENHCKFNKIPTDHVTGSVDCDHFHMHNTYALSATTNPLFQCEDGMLLTSLTMDGYQSWISDGDGFQWLDTTSTGVSNGLRFDNVRTEQGAQPYKAFNITHNTGVQNLVFNSCLIGDRDGYYLRNSDGVTFNACWYTLGSGIALDADATVQEIHGNNCFWQAASTVVLAGQRLMYATPKFPNTGALAPTFHYTTTANAARAFVGDEVNETPTLNSFTEVVGGGAITPTIRWTQQGNRVSGEVLIACTGGATIASTANTSNITSTNLPTAAHRSVCTATTGAVGDGGNGLIENAVIYTPTWVAGTGNFIIHFSYEIT